MYPYIDNNPIFAADSYKLSHWNQYPDRVTKLSFYLNARKASEEKPVVFFGLRYILNKLDQQCILMSDITDAEEAVSIHFNNRPDILNVEGFEHIVRDHEGHYPVDIWAVPEGTVVRDDRALLVIENTCPKCFWVPGFLETQLDQVWAPITVASNSFSLREDIAEHILATGSDPSSVEFKVHDFGVRGASSMESAAICGMAHLTSFKGTDNLPALELAYHQYGVPVAGFSVPASEHSVATAWGPFNEVGYISRMVRNNRGYPFSIVLDSYDVYRAVNKIGYYEPVPWRMDGTTLVMRPDSGDPLEVVPRIFDMLRDRMVKNDAGYLTLPPYLRMIQGDGMTAQQICELLSLLQTKGYSADNIVFGMGSGLLQEIRRDDYGFTMKASYIEYEGGHSEGIYKTPLTMPEKSSKGGRQVSPEMYKVYSGELGLIRRVDDEWKEIRARIDAARGS